MRRASCVEVNADDVGGFKAIRAPEMHPHGHAMGIVRFNAKADVWALGILLTEAILITPIEEQVPRAAAVATAAFLYPRSTRYVLI